MVGVSADVDEETAEYLDILEYQEFCIHAAYDVWLEAGVYGPITKDSNNETQN